MNTQAPNSEHVTGSRKRHEALCMLCGQPFTATSRKTRCCSRRCMGLLDRRETEKQWEKWKAFRAECGGMLSESDPHESSRGVRHQSWHSMLGTCSDADLARQIGISQSAVTMTRNRLHVPVYQKPEPIWHALAGTMLDREVAAIGGVSKPTVCNYRRARNIAPHHNDSCEAA